MFPLVFWLGGLCTPGGMGSKGRTWVLLRDSSRSVAMMIPSIARSRMGHSRHTNSSRASTPRITRAS